MRGWAAGFGYFLVGTWWVGEAFMVDAATHGWQAPFAVILLPAGLGPVLGRGRAGLPGASPCRAARRVLVFAAVFALFEWLRGHVLTGFPWNLPGEAWRRGLGPVASRRLDRRLRAELRHPGDRRGPGGAAGRWTAGAAAS